MRPLRRRQLARRPRLWPASRRPSSGRDSFGGAAGDPAKGYYSYDLGNWHLVALNAEISTGPGSAQDAWLQSDLAATTQRCILAYWHEPRFSSGYHGSEVVNGDTYGVLRLTLRDDGYDWRFVPVAGSSFTDSGSASCH